MNRLFLLACCAIATMAVPLFAINHLEIMHVLQGEYVDSRMGMSLASLDFNGDGINDLIVHQGNNPRPEHQGVYQYGRLMVMYGGNNFDTTPDLTIFADPFDSFPSRKLLSVGDVNGDSFDDFIVVKKTWTLTPGYWRVCVFFGGTNPATTPGFQIDYPGWDSGARPGVESILPRALGDINGDGYSDIGIICHWSGPSRRQIQVLWGGSLTLQTVYDTYIDVHSVPTINGVGDVNNDGFSDFIIGHCNYSDNSNVSINLFYGCQNISQCDSLSLVEYSTIEDYMKPMPCGDVNGDGYDDFLGRVVYTNSNHYGYLWYGSNEITSQWSRVLWPAYFGPYWSDYDLVFGDLNGDGFDDLIGSDYEEWGGSGRVAIRMGKQNFNGTVDLYLNAPDEISTYSYFGYSMACGDFNNDGFDDLAVGAPEAPPGLSDVTGALVIYSGNAQLSDTTVANEDELAPQLTDAWSFSTFPNPLPAGNGITIMYQGTMYEKLATKSITVYNIRGQVVHKVVDTSRCKEFSMQLPHLGSGVYIVKIHDNNKGFSQKLVITK